MSGQRVSLHIWAMILVEQGVHKDEDSCSLLRPCSAAQLCTSHPGNDGGGLQQEYCPGDLC